MSAMVKRLDGILDYDSLEKGHIITKGVLALVIQEEIGTVAHSLALLTLSERVKEEKRVRGFPVTTRCLGGEIHILTDSEAAAYNARRVAQHMHGAAKAHDRNSKVNAANLTEVERSAHQRTLVIHGAMLQAARQEAERMERTKELSTS